MQQLPNLIAIGGASCTGKTSIARAVAAALPSGDCALLPMDSYYRDLSHLSPAERALTNFDDPAAWEWPLLRDHVQSLSQCNTVFIPEYDFVTHTRMSGSTPLTPCRYIVLEGLFALRDPEIRACCSVLAYVESAREIALERRVHRDVLERGRTRESVLQQFSAHVGPMSELHITPTRAFANLLLNGTDPPVVSAQRILDRLEPRFKPDQDGEVLT